MPMVVCRLVLWVEQVSDVAVSVVAAVADFVLAFVVAYYDGMILDVEVSYTLNHVMRDV